MPWTIRSRAVPPSRPWLWVLMGAWGLALVSAGPVLDSNGLLEHDAAWWRLVVTVPGHLMVLWAWWQLGPLWKRPVLTAALWALVMIAVPPLHSRDAFSYAAQGWLVANDVDPYAMFSGDAGLPGYLVGIHWYETTSVYPPLSLQIFEAVHRLFDGHLYFTAVGMRLPNLLAIVVLVWALKRLARRTGTGWRVVMWAGVLNPVVLVQWVGGAHNDAVMVAALALAFLAAHDTAWRGWRGMLLGGAGIGLAMSIKQSAAVAGIGLVALAWAASQEELAPRQRTWTVLALRAFAAGVAAVGVFVVISLATGLGFGWNNDTAGSPLMATSNAPLSWIASFMRYYSLAPDSSILGTLSLLSTMMVLLGVVVLVLRYGPRPPGETGKPWALVIGSLTAFAVLGPALQPWYFTWILPFAVLAHPSLRWAHLWLVATVVASVIPALQDAWAPYTSMAVLAIPTWLLWRSLRRRATPVFAGDRGLT